MDIYGLHPAEELLQGAPESVEAVYVRHNRPENVDEIVESARGYGLDVRPVEPGELDRMAEGGNHQGVVVRTYGFEYAELDDLIASTASADRAGLLVLDQVQDPRNLGAMIRSAAAVGFDGVVIPADRAAGVTPAVVRTSAGCAFRLPIARVTNVSRSLEALKEGGYWAVGTRPAGASPPWEIDFDMKTALVMGGEHQGMRRLVGETCDLHAAIPLAGGVESLNVAAAATAMLYEVRRQWATG